MITVLPASDHCETTGTLPAHWRTPTGNRSLVRNQSQSAFTCLASSLPPRELNAHQWADLDNNNGKIISITQKTQ
jgi:hypothetical protein